MCVCRLYLSTAAGHGVVYLLVHHVLAGVNTGVICLLRCISPHQRPEYTVCPEKSKPLYTFS